MFTLIEVERNSTGLHRDATKLFIFSAVEVPQLLSHATLETSQLWASDVTITDYSIKRKKM